MASRRRTKANEKIAFFTIMLVIITTLLGKFIGWLNKINWMPLILLFCLIFIIYKSIAIILNWWKNRVIEKKYKQEIKLLQEREKIFFVQSQKLNNQRRVFLLRKYQNDYLVNNIINGYYWIGQSEEQLIDSIGKPIDVERKVLAKKIKEVWKYQKTGQNRYALKIMLDNGFVVGWDKK